MEEEARRIDGDAVAVGWRETELHWYYKLTQSLYSFVNLTRDALSFSPSEAYGSYKFHTI